MEINISDFNDRSRTSELVSLFANGLGQETREHFLWRFFPDAGAPRLMKGFAAQDETGRIIGFSSLLFGRYGGGYSGAGLCDWIVHPDFRGKGVISRMYRHVSLFCQSAGCDFFYGFPNSNSYPILFKYGFEDMDKIICAVKDTHIFPPSRNGYEPEIFDGCEFVFSESCPLNADPPEKDGRLIRTRDMLKWKYDANPDEKFRWLVVRDNDTKKELGYFVFSLTKGRLRTAANIYDWDFYRRDDALFAHAVSMIGKRANYVSVFGRYDETDKKLLDSAGLIKTAPGANFILKPLGEKGYPLFMSVTRADTDY